MTKEKPPADTAAVVAGPAPAAADHDAALTPAGRYTPRTQPTTPYG